MSLTDLPIVVPPQVSTEIPSGAEAAALELGVTLGQRVLERAFSDVHVAQDARGARRMLTVLKPGVSDRVRSGFAGFHAAARAAAPQDGLLAVGAATADRTAFVHEAWVGTTADLVALDYSINRKLELFRTVCRAVARVHENGRLHGCLCPQNVMLDGDLQPRLVEVGVIDVGASLLGDLDNTHGYGAFAAPEVRRGLAFDERADVFSLGRLLGFYILGTTPDPDVADSERPDPPAGVPRGVCCLARRATAQAPDERYPTVKALMRDLDPLCANAQTDVVCARSGSDCQPLGAVSTQQPNPAPRSRWRRWLWGRAADSTLTSRTKRPL